jgi:hypothetical protein
MLDKCIICKKRQWIAKWKVCANCLNPELRIIAGLYKNRINNNIEYVFSIPYILGLIPGNIECIIEI